jgi:hypothetical protein
METFLVGVVEGPLGSNKAGGFDTPSKEDKNGAVMGPGGGDTVVD